MASHVHAPWIVALEEEARLDHTNAALTRLSGSLRRADEAIERAVAELREAGLAQSDAEFYLRHGLNFEAASTRVFLAQQLHRIGREIRDRITGVAQIQARVRQSAVIPATVDI